MFPSQTPSTYGVRPGIDRCPELRRGQRVCVEGRIESRSWVQPETGERGRTIEIRADSVLPLRHEPDLSE